MTTLFQRRRAALACRAATAALTMGLVSIALAICGSPASADSPACSDNLSAPLGPATVSVALTSFGKVLVVGSGDNAGCSLYVLTSDRLHALTGAPFACSDDTNLLGPSCDAGLWPALLTKGAPIAGAGVNPSLLGTVTRTDLPGMPAEQQVTYAGLPLYRFFLDDNPGQTEGANLFDPVTSPTGIWYLVSPRRGHPATGQTEIQLETAPVGTGPDETVLAATMDNDFQLLPGGVFPVYTASGGHGHQSLCEGVCADQYWPPVLTHKRPIAGPGVDQNALGTVTRSDGTHQVTYHGQPLFLYYNDAYIPNTPYAKNGAAITGAGLVTPWGVFNPIQVLP